MEKLNELVELAEKADSVANLMDNVNPHTILAVAEAYRALEQRAEAAEAKYDNRSPTEWAYQQACAVIEKHRLRAEAAEAKLAELAKQKPIGWLNDAYLGRGVIDGEVGEDDFGPGYIPIYRHPFNDVPAPAADLAELVPEKASMADYYENVRSGEIDPEEAGIAMWDACRAAILRNLEEASKK